MAPKSKPKLLSEVLVDTIRPDSSFNQPYEVLADDNQPFATLQAASFISLTIDEAKKILELYRNIESADAHYRTCQAQNFRAHVQSTYKAPNISAAFEALKASVKAFEEGV